VKTGGRATGGRVTGGRVTGGLGTSRRSMHYPPTGEGLLPGCGRFCAIAGENWKTIRNNSIARPDPFCFATIAIKILLLIPCSLKV